MSKIMELTYITIEMALEIHNKTITHSGGGTRESLNLSNLESVLEFIQNDDYYPNFVDKLTHLFYSVCQFHCFADGNKRLAITLSAYFLLVNGYMAVAQDFFKLTEMVALNVASGKIDKTLLGDIMLAILDGTYEDDEELKLNIYCSIQ